MVRKLCFLTSTIGMKFIMGVSGFIWAGFVLAHMLGNFLLFAGADAYNSYSHALTSGKIIYIAEGALIFSLVSHIVMGIRLTIKNKISKGSRYHVAASGEKKVSFASQTMIIQGSIILFFVINHLITFKFGTHYSTNVQGQEMRDIFRLVREVFSSPGYVVGYVFCMLLLSIHLSHGVKSLFQSFGINNRAHDKKIKMISMIYALIVGGGFLIQPIYVYFLNKN